MKVPDTGSQVEMSSKFGAEPGDAYNLIKQAFDLGLVVEGLSFHVGSQCTNFDNYTAALTITSEIFNDSRQKGYNLKIVDIGGGFPVPYDSQVPKFEKLAAVINSECERLFPHDIEIIAEPGRFMVATAAVLISEIIGKARRDGKDFLPHKRRRLSHVLRRCLRPLDSQFPAHSNRAKKRSVPLSGRPATVSTKFPFRNSFRAIWKSAIIFTRRI